MNNIFKKPTLQLRIANKSNSELTAANQSHENVIKELNEQMKEMGENETKMFENNR